MTTRIATVGYLNARPLTDYLDRDRFEVVEGHPSEIATLLREGAVDLALVPVAAALTDGAFRIVPEVCIGALGPVHSVLLVAETEPEDWTEVVLDGVSRTSRTLARLLLTEGPLGKRVRSDLVLREGDLGEGVKAAGGTVAGLVIGDAARVVPEHLTVQIDLSEQWHAWHGLPFVFAVWAGRPDLPGEVVDAVREAGRTGLANRAQDHAGADLDYVTRSIRYALDDRALTGLRRYAAIAKRAGLVGTEDVELYDPTRRVIGRRDLDALLTDAADGEALSRDDLLALASDARTADLTAAAAFRRDTLDGTLTTVRWTLGRTIVTTDVDVDGFGPWKAPGESDALVRTPDDVAALVEEAGEVEAGDILLVGGHHPGLGTDAWCKWIAAARSASDARIRALSLEGIRHLSAVDDLPVEAIVARLREAGLDMLAEDAVLALDPTVRSGARWLSPRQFRGLLPVLADAGIEWLGGLEVGAGESVEARIDHLLSLREHRLAGVRITPLTAERAVRPEGATAEDHIRTVALARLALDGLSHQAAWLAGAPGLAQVALHAGADALGTVLLGAREADGDTRFVNPRARVGKKREVDPWRELIGEVEHALKRSGFASERERPGLDLTPADAVTPQPRA